MLVALLALSASMLLLTAFAVSADLAAMETGLLVTRRRRLGEVRSPWLRSGWWPGG